MDLLQPDFLRLRCESSLKLSSENPSLKAAAAGGEGPQVPCRCPVGQPSAGQPCGALCPPGRISADALRSMRATVRVKHGLLRSPRLLRQAQPESHRAQNKTQSAADVFGNGCSGGRVSHECCGERTHRCYRLSAMDALVMDSPVALDVIRSESMCAVNANGQNGTGNREPERIFSQLHMLGLRVGERDARTLDLAGEPTAAQQQRAAPRCMPCSWQRFLDCALLAQGGGTLLAYDHTGL